MALMLHHSLWHFVGRPWAMIGTTEEGFPQGQTCAACLTGDADRPYQRLLICPCIPYPFDHLCRVGRQCGKEPPIGWRCMISHGETHVETPWWTQAIIKAVQCTPLQHFGYVTVRRLVYCSPCTQLRLSWKTGTMLVSFHSYGITVEPHITKSSV